MPRTKFYAIVRVPSGRRTLAQAAGPRSGWYAVATLGAQSSIPFLLIPGGSIFSAEMWARRQPARTLSTLLAVSALLVLSSGCGGGNESAGTSAASTSTTSSSTTPSAPTHAEFVSELDAWCARGNRRFAPLIAQFNKAALTNDAEGAASALQRTIPLRARYDARLHGITPSREDRAAFARFLGDETRIAGLSRRMVAALKAKNEEEANRLASFVHAARNDRTKAALDLGTTQCGA